MEPRNVPMRVPTYAFSKTLTTTPGGSSSSSWELITQFWLQGYSFTVTVHFWVEDNGMAEDTTCTAKVKTASTTSSSSSATATAAAVEKETASNITQF
jgi:hypothetical protein